MSKHLRDILVEGMWTKSKEEATGLFGRYLRRKGLDIEDYDGDDGELENMLPRTADKVSFKKHSRIKVNGKPTSLTLLDFWEPSFEQEVYKIFKKAGRHEYIPVDAISSNQYFVSHTAIVKKINKKGRDFPNMPYVLKIGNLYHLVDGNHRVHAAKLKGEGRVLCNVLYVEDVT